MRITTLIGLPLWTVTSTKKMCSLKLNCRTGRRGGGCSAPSFPVRTHIPSPEAKQNGQGREKGAAKPLFLVCLRHLSTHQTKYRRITGRAPRVASRLPAMMVSCGRVLSLVSLVIRLRSNSIRLSSSRPLRHAGGTREVFDGGLSYYSICVSFN